MSEDARPIWPVYTGIDGNLYLAVSMPYKTLTTIEQFFNANREWANRLDLSGLTVEEIIARLEAVMAADEKRAAELRAEAGREPSP